ncbi:uncharacterized protein TNCV_2462261 [Trichonephila clavipes]|nr:uncharacterized protein TNCV_2462261 [Trichonephila clavipes]
MCKICVVERRNQFASTAYGQTGCGQVSAARTLYKKKRGYNIVLRSCSKAIDDKSRNSESWLSVKGDTWNGILTLQVSTPHQSEEFEPRDPLVRGKEDSDYQNETNNAAPVSMSFEMRNIMKNNLVALHFKYDQARRRFVEWAQNEIAVVPDFHKRILFSDEAHFWLNGYVNKQNYRIWSEANPQVYVETPLHPEKLTVWCALWAGGILLQKR